ncbi:glycosyltransferase [Terriglobus roseus DSM 18391]|uniref:Glycosyltransferase n=1 Tax=Terriglobus roseus (strain DSM 18391 / NRRL B-41598 / KBS 63) TaxID=926566 RepID=I3ZE87_TERRK|nr:glycosyltransferase [Terriglobus roseus]AFL87555.1 glycosyltransferase [Terriglobus roseus DSM 18391]
MSTQTLVTESESSAAIQSKQRSVLFLIDQLTELGGAERMMFALADALPRHGYQVTVVTLRDQVSEEAHKLARDIVVLPIHSCFSLEGLRAIRTLVRMMREREVSLVQTYCESSDLIGVFAARLAGVHNLCSSRRDMGILRSLKHRVAYKFLAPLYTRVIAVSDGVAERHRQMDGLAAGRMAVIRNGVDLDRYRLKSDATRILPQLGIPTNMLLVTTVANVNRWKGLDVFLKAAALVRQRNADVHFAIAGDWTDGQHLKELRALAEQLCVTEYVHFLGHVDDVPSLLRASDVFLLLSRSEGFPNVVIEAMAASLPVIATDVGGTREALLDGVTGYLVADQDHHAAAQHMISLLSHANKRRLMGAAGRQLVEENFSIQTMVKRHMEVYDAILAK